MALAPGALPETPWEFREALARKRWFEHAAATGSRAFAAYTKRAALRAEALREAEVRPGVTALTGRRIEDTNGGEDISAVEWVQFVRAATDIGGADGCAFVAGGVSLDQSAGALGGAAVGALADCLLRRPAADLPTAPRG